MKLYSWIFTLCPVLAFTALFSPAHLEAQEQEPDETDSEKSQFEIALKDWFSPAGKHDEETYHWLIREADQLEHPDLVDRLSVGGDPAKIEIKPPTEIDIIHAKEMLSLGSSSESGIPVRDYGGIPYVFRRMTRDRFEAWTPKRGWLFDKNGKLLNQAVPPRHDGAGREWFGAFLPDGRWATTDLWETDSVFYIFSREGKQLREIKASGIGPHKEEWDTNVVDWARCDREGKGWVTAIGGDGNGPRALAFLQPSGKPQLLIEPSAPWKLCYIRDMEPKGAVVDLFKPSDDFKDTIHGTSTWHGPLTLYTFYKWNNTRLDKAVYSANHNFGFLPGSHNVFMSVTNIAYDDKRDPLPPKYKTWFYSAKGNCLGWTQANYLADAPDGKGIWLLDNDHCVVALNASLKPQSLTHFLIGDKQATPLKIFPDLGLGFFSTGDRVVLASW